MASLLDPSMSWEDVDALRKIWTGPVILKGVLHPDEARMAVEHILRRHGVATADVNPLSLGKR